jgi:hypothetical protein
MPRRHIRKLEGGQATEVHDLEIREKNDADVSHWIPPPTRDLKGGKYDIWDI